MSEDSDKRFDPVYTWSGQPKRFEELSWGRQVYLSIYWCFGGLMLIIAAYFFLIGLIASGGDLIVAWRSLQYNTSTVVYDSQRPHDCDFMHAPIGNKDCHYERVYYKDGKVLHVGWNKVDD